MTERISGGVLVVVLSMGTGIGVALGRWTLALPMGLMAMLSLFAFIEKGRTRP